MNAVHCQSFMNLVYETNGHKKVVAPSPLNSNNLVVTFKLEFTSFNCTPIWND